MINRKKILVADNDPSNLEFFELMLNKLGFEFIKAENGEEAIEKIAEVSPDLVLLETVMPKISGWEVLKTIKKDPKNEALPVLLLSKIDDVKDIVEGFELGADDYIIKPFNFSVLLARIRASLRSRVLISELSARESRLALTEKFNSEIKKNISSLKKAVNDTNKIVKESKELTVNKKNFNIMLETIEEKIRVSQGNIKNLEQNVKNLQKDWDVLKKKEIELPILEKPIRDPVG
ncbi:MAG: hypothetical protein Ta2G_18690 [Termitinemataceae bacterium]|nr:MAG: hypothetical protein Ta2G_18690 [Termitinemataceae bacterium]